MATRPRKPSIIAQRKAPAEPNGPPSQAAAHDFLPVLKIARELKSWADKALSLAEGTADMSVAAARAATSDPRKKAAVAKTGEFLRAAREAAGITTAQLGAAIDLADPSIIDNAEQGSMASLPFDTILRLAGVLGRNDPLAFALNLTRSHNPQIWEKLEQYGIGKLAAQAGREREFMNIYRANDAARQLSDKEFARVREFVAASFNMAVEFFQEVD